MNVFNTGCSILVVGCAVLLLREIAFSSTRGVHETYADGPTTRKEYNPLAPSSPRLKDQCSGTINLSLIKGGFDNNVFFLETSGRDHLLSRQACAVESAARFANLQVVVLLNSHGLSLTDEVTCKLLRRLGSRIHFYRIDFASYFTDTPLADFYRKGEMSKNRKFSTVHLSDALRLAVIFKFGGFYLDLDYVVLRPLDQLINFFSSSSSDGSIVLTNSVFQFGKGAKFLKYVMEHIPTSFHASDRFTIGPLFVTKRLRDYCNLNKTEEVTVIDNVSHQCDNITILDPEQFSSVRWFHWKKLWPQKYKQGYFEELFAHDKAVHFYNFLSHTRAVEKSDEKKSAYAHLGPWYCPYSLEFSSVF